MAAILFRSDQISECLEDLPRSLDFGPTKDLAAVWLTKHHPLQIAPPRALVSQRGKLPQRQQLHQKRIQRSMRHQHPLAAHCTVVIAVGQTPNYCWGFSGGGGGTFISLFSGTGAFASPTQHTPILVAGGGGGGSGPRLPGRRAASIDTVSGAGRGATSTASPAKPTQPSKSLFMPSLPPRQCEDSGCGCSSHSPPM